jgi:hypothetical protein
MTKLPVQLPDTVPWKGFSGVVVTVVVDVTVVVAVVVTVVVLIIVVGLVVVVVTVVVNVCCPLQAVNSNVNTIKQQKIKPEHLFS